ncbi:MAG: translation initiation factor IF-1 [Firmicutes bacterium]|nr:translation initiation factor IF-1 [Bacillota bacterium]
MSKSDLVEMSGIVTEALPNVRFKVRLDNNKEVIGFLSGKLRVNFIKIIPGDKVKLEMSPYDLTQGRIVWRDKAN